MNAVQHETVRRYPAVSPPILNVRTPFTASKRVYPGLSRRDVAKLVAEMIG